MFAIALLALMTTFAGAARAADETLTVTLKAQNGSGQDGTATITKTGENSVHVVVHLSNGTAEPQPAHIHPGTCATLNPKPTYPLTNVVNGDSVTDVNANIEDLANEGFAINVHKSAAEVGTYVSCGDIHEMAAGGTSTGTTSTGGTTMPTTGNGDMPLFLGGLALLALALTGAGLRLARNRA
jgi:hypothetical protein